MKTSNARWHLANEPFQKSLIKLQINSALKRIVQRFVQFLSSGNEPEIWTKTDRYGNIIWQAYDPISRRSVSRRSEAEMREWLEQRYYN
jgi:Cdc6-like AAA superfamily ATPase